MRIRSRIITAVMAVIAVLTLLYSFYYLDSEREQSLERLQSTIDEHSSLLQVVMAGPLYDGDVGQLRDNIHSFFRDPDIVYISLTEFDGDIKMVEQRQIVQSIGETIASEVVITRGLDELGVVNVKYTTANIEQRLIQSRNKIFVFSLILILLNSLVIYLIVRGLTIPIENLTIAARKMAEGDLEQNINIEGAEELIVLGQSFVSMRDSIKEKIDDLAEKNEQLTREIREHGRTQQALVDSERKYRTFFEKSNNPMMLTSGTKFIDGNQAILDLLGLTSVDELTRLTLEDISPEFQPDGTRSSDEMKARIDKLSEVGSSANFEIYHQRANGEIFPVAVSSTVILVAGEPITHTIWQDISDRKQAEEELNRHRYHLEELVRERTNELATVNRELEAFSYSVSHDLRAPLRAIDGFSQALIEDYGTQFDETGKDYLSRVRAGAQNMAALIDSMLQLSRMSRAELRIERVSLSDMAQEIIAKLHNEEPDRVVDVDIQPGMIAQGDRGLLRIMLDNLLGNAWKYTSKTPHAEIKFGINSSGSAPEYYVSDNGAGFDMRYVDKLFGAFQRLHDAETFPGTGIGLATVQRVVSRHQGSVRAEGKVGEGATFYFVLASGRKDRQKEASTIDKTEQQLTSAG